MNKLFHGIKVLFLMENKLFPLIMELFLKMIWLFLLENVLLPMKKESFRNKKDLRSKTKKLFPGVNGLFRKAAV